MKKKVLKPRFSLRNMMMATHGSTTSETTSRLEASHPMLRPKIRISSGTLLREPLDEERPTNTSKGGEGPMKANILSHGADLRPSNKGLDSAFSRPPGKARKKGSNGTIPPSPKNERGNVVVLESPHSLGTMKQLSGAHSTTELTAHHAGLPGPVMPKAREMGFLSLSFLRPYVAIWEGPGGVKGDPINLFRPRIISLWAWSYFTVEKQKKASIFKFNSDIARFFFGCEPVPNQNTQQALALPEKEVIQSHLPVRLPCYDFTLVTSPAFDIPLLAVKVTTSGMASSRSVTGGVHKAREQIHCRMADRRLLVILASCSLQSELRMGF
ncbi:hypothetical protein V6N12_066118 [Hibiscus sabdariffa]|uniref:Uncharacterized protein n=1 Tax=Hibiscus sabdariffa TaxID=183260 RepID=A0ABR2ARR2_9ROSI